MISDIKATPKGSGKVNIKQTNNKVMKVNGYSLSSAVEIKPRAVTSQMSKVILKDFKASQYVIADSVVKSNAKKGVGITNVDALLRYWRVKGQRAASFGNTAHSLFEQMWLSDTYSTDNSEQVTLKSGYDKAVYRFYAELKQNWNILEVEYKVIDTVSMLSGKIDIIVRNKVTGKLAIIDLKTTEDVNKKLKETSNNG